MPRTGRSPRIAWETHGAGPPVLLVMGFGMRGVVWRPVVERLRTDHQVCTYDNRGTGDSDTVSAPYTLADLADDAVAVADDLGWEEFHLAGVSMGGMIAQELVLRRPERVRSLTLIATQSGGPRAWIPPLRSLPVLLGIAAGSRRLNRRLFPRLLHPPGSLVGVAPDALEQRWRDAHEVPIAAEQRRLQLRAIRRHDTRDRLSRIAVPTLVVKPLQDRMCHAGHSDRLADAIPSARLLELDAGHGLVFHAADALAAAIAQQVQSIEVAKP